MKSGDDPYQVSRIFKTADLSVDLYLIHYIPLSWQRGQG